MKSSGKVTILLAAGGLLSVVAGLAPIGASSGHWPITEWLLHFIMQRSVSNYSLLVKAPSLDAPGLVLKGAGHYEIGCRLCHGTRDLQRPVVTGKMTPHPPHLADTLAQWTPEQLFYIVKHGVKFTGMPAWPAQKRDDEVWAMVAFLMKFPQMPMQEYNRLARGERAPQKDPAQNSSGLETPSRTATKMCGGCHGVDGRGRGPGSSPVLAGQTIEYLENAMSAFALGRRHSGTMEAVAAELDSHLMRDVASYYSRLDGLTFPSAPRPTQSDLKRGESIAWRGIPNQRVPACMHCHGPEWAGRNAAYPVLSGQDADYLYLQLILLKEQRRGGSAYAHLMDEIAPRLTAGQMRDVAQYYQWLGLR